MASVPTTESLAPRRGRPGYTRDQILDRAVALFNEKGYDATSVADLAERLGVSKSALYHHFDSREQLLDVALDRALGRLEALLDAPAADGSPVERLRSVLHDAVLVLVDELPYVTLLLRVRGNSPVERRALERRRAFDHRVTALVERAQHAGQLRADLDAAVATRLLFGMVNSLTEWYRPGGAVDAHTLADDIVRTGLDGLAVGR